MWKYQQSTGKLWDPSGKFIYQGFAGNGPGLNNPAMQNVSKVGPLPRGLYTIEGAYLHPHLGPVVMNLIPGINNEMFGRSKFRIHGASAHDFKNSSKGCIIQPKWVRLLINSSTDKILEVIE